jgi:hypothetical protein
MHLKSSPKPLLMLKAFNAASKEVQLTKQNSRMITARDSGIDTSKQQQTAMDLAKY